MQLAAYEQNGRAAYAGLAEVISRILAAAVARDGSLHPQQIQHRAKEVASLRKKLAKGGANEADEIEAHAKDLAGVRIIFYTNSDVSRFQNSGVLRDNFEIDWDRTRIHHPTADNAPANELFVSNNYVVRLTDQRAALPEYAPFAGLWCEVQVQTTLNHAWAEMAHDTIYKKPALTGFGSELMKGIEARMARIMRDYLAPAGYAFQKVLSDVDRLSRGQALFEQGIVEAIDQAADNNALYEALSNFHSSVLPHYDDWENGSSDILRAVVRAVERSRELPTEARQTPFGDLAGKTAKDVAEMAASIIEDLRFVDVDQTFDLICSLYRGAEGDEAFAWVKLTSKLAKHHLHVWQEAGPVVQGILMQRVEALSPEDRQLLKPLVLAILREVFATDITGTTVDDDTVTLHQGAVVASDGLRRMRSEALDIARGYDADSLSDGDRSEIIDVLRAAMVMPSYGGVVRPELGEIVLANIAEVALHFAATCARWSYELRQRIEQGMLWTYRHEGEALPGDQTSAAQEAARESMVEAVFAFRDALNADQEFTTYKLLVGFESVFPPAWDDREFDYEGEEAYRREQFGLLIDGIDLGNAKAWLATLRRCAATESNDLATFPSFTEFLQRLAERKPAIAVNYLGQLDARLANFLSPILLGLARTDRWEDTLALVDRWIGERQFLGDIAFAVGVVDALDPDILDRVLSSAIAAADTKAILNVIGAVSRRDGEEHVASLALVLLRALAFASAMNVHYWHRYWLARRGGSAVIRSLADADATLLLGSLVDAPKVNPSLEGVLADLAATHPQAVIDHIGSRIVRRFADGRENDYEAVPYRLRRLRTALADAAILVVRSARGWYAAQPDFFSYHGGKFLQTVYPEFAGPLEEALRPYIGTGDPQDARFVLETMRAYSGEPFLHPLAKAVISSLPPDDDLIGFVEVVLHPTGVTSGEFGRVNRLKQLRATINHWSDDDCAPVKAFAVRFGGRLDNEIRSEQRRSEEHAALHRLEYERAAAEAPSEDDHRNAD